VDADALTCLAGALVALVVAVVTTPAGVSGAVLLLPVQVGLLGVPNPAATPTNLVYNVVATPGPLARHIRRGALEGALTAPLVLASLPGVLAGGVLRATVLDGPRAVAAIIAVVLLPLGLVLALAPAAGAASTRPRPTGAALPALCFCVGVVGGLYGIGGGAVLAPLLVAGGRAVHRVAPAALATTLATSVAGVVLFDLIALAEPGPNTIGPDWALGVSMGLGGLAGGLLGARLAPRLPERLLRRLLGFLALGVAIRYAVVALSG
jgi:uncharacterized protein